jgi:alpha-L-fucosidase
LNFSNVNAQQTANRPERVEWFENLAFGMFIHWNVDVALGGVISHSLAGASDDYAQRYFTELPGYFNPSRFDPAAWARKAKLAGMKYVVFTAKHHSGFCMFATKTTTFNVMNTPYGKDVAKQIVEAFRKEGIAIGFYFSPEDFHFFHQHNIPMGRLQQPEQFPVNNPELMEYDKRQLRELMTNYGKIDILFIDGPGDGLREYAWSLNPNLVITRDVMKTPEQNTLDAPLPRPWEACYTTGTEWSFKATNDVFKSGTDVINKLIEIRSKGGNFLLNVGPTQEGIIQEKEANVLTEISMWMFANSESIYNIKPLPVIREGRTYFSQSNDGKHVYAYILRKDASDWRYGTRKTFTFSHLEGSSSTKVSVLGYGSKLVEYRKGFDAGVYIIPSPIGLTVSAVNGQRFYTDNQWPNAVVLKIDGATFRENIKKEKSSTIDGAK